MSTHLQTMLQQAIQAFQDGDFDGADTSLNRVIQVDEKNLPALHILGLIKAAKGNYREAADYLSRAARIHPNDPSIQYNLAKALSDCELDKESIPHHKKAVQLAPNNPESWLNYGKTLSSLKRYDQALDCFDTALKLNPNFAEAALNKGATLKELRRYEEAIVFARQASEINPNLVEAYLNKGIALKQLKRYDEAIDHYDKALSLNPNFQEAWNSRGVALHELKRYHEALAHYDKALSLDPNYAQAWCNKGVALYELKRYDEAIAHYDKALSLTPNIDWAYGNLAYAKMRICDWSGFPESLENISQKVMASESVAQPFLLLALNDAALLHKKSSELYIQLTYPFSPVLGPIPKKTQRQKIRLGYFSGDFRTHAVAYLTSELFEIHDRERFEVFAFSLQKTSLGDELSLRLRKGFDRFIEVENMSDQEIAELARKLEIDIAIDLSGLTQDSRTGIFSYRAAPIQVNWLGYPGTIGADYIDYIVADKIIIPESHRQFYKEKVVYLPDTYIVDDSKRSSSSRVFTREECELPENVFVFCCFNNDYKFNPYVLDSWSRILLTVKHSVLWISENNKQFRVNLLSEFNKRGIVTSRIVFAQRVELMSDNLARYALADLFLDTHPYNAHSTALDSLKSGVPVLTLIGNSFAGRVAASLLNAIDLPGLITNSWDEYEALAIELATSPIKMNSIKEVLKENILTTPLFDTRLFAKNLEAAYTGMYQRHLKDFPPEEIII